MKTRIGDSSKCLGMMAPRLSGQERIRFLRSLCGGTACRKPGKTRRHSKKSVMLATVAKAAAVVTILLPKRIPKAEDVVDAEVEAEAEALVVAA